MANSGFLLRSGSDKVLIDAIFREGLADYPSLSSGQRRQMERGEPPFDGVDLVLATHVHEDHFSAASVTRFLANHPRAVFVSTPEATEAVLSQLPDDSAIRRQVHVTRPAQGKPFETLLNGIQLRAFALPHRRGNGRTVENLGFLVHFGDASVLHIGDAGVTPEEFRAAGWTQRDVTLAFLPSWILLSEAWQRTLPEIIGPQRLSAMHIAEWDAVADQFSPARDLEGLIRQLREARPEAVIPRESMETFEVWRQPPGRQ